MAVDVPDWLNPEDLAGLLVVVVGLLGFADVVSANDMLSTWVVLIGLAAIIGGRTFRKIADMWGSSR